MENSEKARADLNRRLRAAQADLIDKKKEAKKMQAAADLATNTSIRTNANIIQLTEEKRDLEAELQDAQENLADALKAVKNTDALSAKIQGLEDRNKELTSKLDVAEKDLLNIFGISNRVAPQGRSGQTGIKRGREESLNIKTEDSTPKEPASKRPKTTTKDFIARRDHTGKNSDDD